MFCHKCGKEISSESNFCMYCGKKQPSNGSSINASTMHTRKKTRSPMSLEPNVFQGQLKKGEVIYDQENGGFAKYDELSGVSKGRLGAMYDIYLSYIFEKRVRTTRNGR